MERKGFILRELNLNSASTRLITVEGIFGLSRESRPSAPVRVSVGIQETLKFGSQAGTRPSGTWIDHRRNGLFDLISLKLLHKSACMGFIRKCQDFTGVAHHLLQE
jgi:hypothetical protein